MSLALDGLTNGARQGRIPDIDRRRIGQGSLRNAGEKAADPSSRGGASLRPQARSFCGQCFAPGRGSRSVLLGLIGKSRRRNGTADRDRDKHAPEHDLFLPKVFQIGL
ncbi:hypothetical protein D3C72_638250 [compost metagenome]